MQSSTRLMSLAVLACASTASAQAPMYFDLSPGSWATDVVVLPGSGSGSGDVVVVGTDSTGTVFRWRFSTQTEVSLGELADGGNTRQSADGSKVSTTTVGLDGISRAARYDGTTWTQGPGLGGQSGPSESTSYGISGDGNVVGGLAWIVGGAAHAYTWTQPNAVGNLGGSFSDPSSRLNALNHTGSVVVGWKNLLNGTRQGAYWVNGVLQPQFMLGAQMLGEALNVNAAGTSIVGTRIYNGVGPNATAGWRWDAGVVTPLLNLAGETTLAVPTDVTDDGSLVVGHSGGSLISGTRDILWLNNSPVSLHAYLASLSTAGIGAYPDLGYVSAISADGGAICGRGTGIGLGQPAGGWVVIFPSALPAGTPFCLGDGTATACPCGNAGAAGNGCASSVNAAGARLTATGSPSIGADTLRLFGSGMPNSSALYFQGTAQLNGGAGAVFGDGLRCAGGSVIRLGTKSNVAGSSAYPAAGDPSISVRGAITSAGSVRTYQIWYRNAAAFCSPATFNLSNGLQLTWGV